MSGTARHTRPRSHAIAGRTAALIVGLGFVAGVVGSGDGPLGASNAQAAPPVVVETVPAPTESGVDPALAELRLVFDQDMLADQFSACGGGVHFPKTTGRPQWIDKRTLVLPVALEPDHAYELSLNCPRASNFQNVAGERLVPYPVAFRTRAAGAPAPAPLSPDEHRRAIERLRSAISERYSYRDLRKVDWNQQFAEHEARLKRAVSSAAFAQAVVNLLRPAQDPHVWVEVNQTTLGTFAAPAVPNFNLMYLAQHVPDWRQRGAQVYCGRFADGVGYLLIGTFSGDEAAIQPALDALEEMKDAPGLILDVRANGGGNERMAQRLAACFVERPAVYSRHEKSAPDVRGGWSKPIDRVIAPAKNAPHFSGRVALLMGPSNMSSCESFLLMMRYGARSQLVGARSRGSSGNPQPHDLGNGVTVFLPSWRDLLPDGTLLEGNGVAPDVDVATTPGELTHSDPVLERALEWMRATEEKKR